MRELRFRLWTGEKMITPSDESDLFFLIHNSGYFELQDHEDTSRVKSVNGMKDLSLYNSEGFDLTLMEYIGKNDINGKPIFDQDIVRIKYPNVTLLIQSVEYFGMMMKQITFTGI